MFVQVITGKTSDAAGARAAADQWMRDLAAGADGWLGSTGGVTDDGRLVMIARFESAEAAQRNSDRPEQGAWWAETAKLLEGEATFRNSVDVTTDVRGDPDQAGFVQVMQGEQGPDPDRVRALMDENSDEWAAFRPEIIGSVGSAHSDGTWTMAMYFTSEADAREGEQKEPPEALKAQMDEMNQLSVGEPEFFDLRDPWLFSP
jgi:quinol monooxygenase YgiN